MKITLHQVTIGDLVEGYADRSENEEGITGLGGFSGGSARRTASPISRDVTTWLARP